MKEFAVRKMVSDDLDQIHAIEKDAFPDLFPPSSFSAELKRPRAEYFVAHSIKNIESLLDLGANLGPSIEKQLQ